MPGCAGSSSPSSPASGPLDVDFWRRELLEHNPLAWLVTVNGVVVDARGLPPEIQADPARRGLIPELPAVAGAS